MGFIIFLKKERERENKRQSGNWAGAKMRGCGVVGVAGDGDLCSASSESYLWTYAFNNTNTCTEWPLLPRFFYFILLYSELSSFIHGGNTK